jgi:signal transduction histidine kinase
MALRLVKHGGDQSQDALPTGAACLVIDAKGKIVEVTGWETLAVEEPPATLETDRADDPPLVRAAAETAAGARRAGSPRARVVEIQTEKQRLYAITAAPLAGPGKAGRLVVTIARTGDPEAGSAEGRVIRQLGHDLRTPLTSISGAVELLQSGRLGGLHPQQEKVLGLMQKGVEQMVRLIDEATAPYHRDRKLGADLGAEMEELFGKDGGS